MISTDKTVNPTNVKRRSFDTYAQTIGALSGASLMPEAPRGRATREDIRLALERQDIESRPLWKPMHLQPVFAGYEAILPRPLPAREGRSVAEALFRDGLCLPSGTAMSEADLARVVEVVRRMHGAPPEGRQSVSSEDAAI